MLLRRASIFDVKLGVGRTRLALLWSIGSVSLTVVTLLCSHLGATISTTAFLLLMIIVILSLLDSIVSSILFSFVANAALNFFFIQPFHTFIIGSPGDIVTLIAFLVTSLLVTGLIRTVHAQADSQREQADLLEITTDAIFATDENGIVTFWNRGAEQLYGWDRKEALGRPATNLLKTAYPEPKDSIEICVDRFGRWEGELEHIARNGRRLLVASRWARNRDRQGRLVGMLQSDRDITEKQRIEDMLRQSQGAYLAEAQNLSQTGSFGWNVATGEIFWSDETFRIFDVEPSVRPSLDVVFSRMHPEDQPYIRDQLDRAVKGRQDFEHEHRLQMPDGSIKHLHVRARGSLDALGRDQFVGAIMDVTAQKKSLIALEQSEQRYRHLFNRMPIAMWQIDATRLVELFNERRREGITDLDRYFDENPDFLKICMESMIYVEANERGAQLFGARSVDDFVGVSIAGTWAHSADTFRRAMLSRFRGDTNFEEETKMATQDGRVIDVLFTTARLGPIDNLTISLNSVIDISERLRTQEKLQRVQAEFAHAARISVLGELTASIAHEINQPLAAVALNGRLALREYELPTPDHSEVRESLNAIVDDVQRATDIIARIRASAIRAEPERASLKLDDVVAEALLFVRGELRANGITIRHRRNPSAPPVRGDRVQLQQVIVNLSINAIHAMVHCERPLRQLTIGVTTADPITLRCIIEDSGSGISAEHMPRLFDSFFTTKETGMGIGLPICRSIIEAHGGRIVVDNCGVDGGARFSFTLPAAR